MSVSNPFIEALQNRLAHPATSYHRQVCGLDCTIESELQFNWRGSIKYPANHPDTKLTAAILQKIYNYPELSLNDDVLTIRTISSANYCLIRETVNRISERNLPYRTFEFIADLIDQIVDTVMARYELATGIPIENLANIKSKNIVDQLLLSLVDINYNDLDISVTNQQTTTTTTTTTIIPAIPIALSDLVLELNSDLDLNTDTDQSSNLPYLSHQSTIFRNEDSPWTQPVDYPGHYPLVEPRCRIGGNAVDETDETDETDELSETNETIGQSIGSIDLIESIKQQMQKLSLPEIMALHKTYPNFFESIYSKRPRQGQICLCGECWRKNFGR